MNVRNKSEKPLWRRFFSIDSKPENQKSLLLSDYSILF